VYQNLNTVVPVPVLPMKTLPSISVLKILDKNRDRPFLILSENGDRPFLMLRLGIVCLGGMCVQKKCHVFEIHATINSENPRSFEKYRDPI